MIYIFLISGIVAGSLGVYTAYSGELKDSIWYLPLGLASAVTTNILWYRLAQKLDGTQLYKIAGVWDLTQASLWLLLPLVVFGVTLKPLGWLGFGFMFIGVILLNIGG